MPKLPVLEASQDSPAPNTDQIAPTTDNASNKRKPEDDSDTTAVQEVQPQPIQKRQRNAVIDDPAAIAFLTELGLDEQFFEDGKVLAWGLNTGDPDFLRIHKYVERGQSTYKGACGIKILSILRVIPSDHSLDQDPNLYLDFKDDPKVDGMKRMMLWYGASQSIVQGIVVNGLELLTYDGLYGTGIYFDDMVGTSCWYTDCLDGCEDIKPQPGKVGYLFLNDVLLGNSYKAHSLMPNLHKPPQMNVTPWWKIWGQEELVKCQSVMGVRSSDPFDCWGNVTIDGCTWPLGYVGGWGCGSNEYVIYNANQVKPKFLIKFESTPKPYYHKMTA